MSRNLPPKKRARLGSMDCSDSEDEPGVDRSQRNRERNKEHARKTRLRKKEQLEGLKQRIGELEDEGNRLKAGIRECSVASILVGLSSRGESHPSGSSRGLVGNSDQSGPSHSFGESLNGKRKRFLSLDGEDPMPVQPMELKIRGQVTFVGGPQQDGRVQINWKTGMFVDESGMRQQLSKKELEELRRERNRLHAKMTRDRKKAYISSIKRVIARLEEENDQLRTTLEQSRALVPPDDEVFAQGQGPALESEADGSDSDGGLNVDQKTPPLVVTPALEPQAPMEPPSPMTVLKQSKDSLSFLSSSRAFYAIG